MNETPRKKAPPRAKSAVLKGWGEPRELTLASLPEGLAELASPPTVAYVWGPLPPAPWVSIVGTRTPSPQGTRDAFHLARRLARSGVTVASGGARGVDSAAHLGALAGRGRTIVIAPTWLPYAYPASNHRLFQRILAGGGAYLTVAEARTRPMKFAFFRRNEVLMALSHATVLGECPLKSGARNAMQHARRLGRPRFALPFRFGDTRALGVWQEIMEQGAELLAEETSLLRLLEEYGPFKNPAWRAARTATKENLRLTSPGPSHERTSARVLLEESSSFDDRPEAERAVLRAILRGEGTVDGVCRATGLAVEQVQHAVLLLTLSGEVVEDERGLLRHR
jgi:DNA processing protein